MSDFQLPEATGVSRVELRTAKLQRSIAFYQGVLGLSPEGAGPRVAFSAGGGGPPLVVLHEDPLAVPRPPRSTGLFHFAIRYPYRKDLARALARLLSADHPIQGASNHLVSEAIYLADPEGNGIELYADLPRSQWVWRDGQVEMGTEPLDVNDLLSAAEGGPASAAPPPETDLGHVHLHVADLETAERFYRQYLGLSVTQRSYPGALFLAAGRYHHHLAVNTWGGPAAPPPDSVGLWSYRLEVPSAETVDRLRQRAAQFGYEVGSVAVGDGPEILRIRDPNGNWLELEASRHPASAT